MFDDGTISEPDINLYDNNGRLYGSDWGFIAEKDGNTWYIRPRNEHKPRITGFRDEVSKQAILDMLNDGDDDSIVTEESEVGSMEGDIEDDDGIPADNIEIGKSIPYVPDHPVLHLCTFKTPTF